ncbi:MAG: EamA family transporter [Endomicrobiaceae bacterium]|nr:EamA family transporter [Endomicrobiaceae bacterium]
MEWIFIGLTIVLWGISPVFDKMALKAIDPVLAVAIRMMTAGSIMFIYAFIFKKIEVIKRLPLKSIMFFIIASSFSLLGFVFYFKALSAGFASKVVPAAATYPLFTSIIAFLLMKESFSLKKLIAIIFIVAGVALIK